MPGVISFLSDFGHGDEFVGVVHGVIAKVAPDVRVIDVNHGVDRGSIRAGALSLLRAIQYLPEGVALAVVDPGVGTARAAIAVQTSWGFFVGPDNGLLSPAVAMVGGAHRVHAIENPELIIPSQGATFDGRDRFAPAAAVLADGQAGIEDMGPTLDPNELVPTLLPLPDVDGDHVRGAAWWIDHFGNVQTNVAPADLAGLGADVGSNLAVQLGAASHDLPYVRAYGDVASGEPMVLIDSQGLAAICVRDGRADETFGLDVDRPVTFRYPPAS